MPGDGKVLCVFFPPLGLSYIRQARYWSHPTRHEGEEKMPEKSQKEGRLKSACCSCTMPHATTVYHMPNRCSCCWELRPRPGSNVLKMPRTQRPATSAMGDAGREEQGRGFTGSHNPGCEEVVETVERSGTVQPASLMRKPRCDVGCNVQAVRKRRVGRLETRLSTAKPDAEPEHEKSEAIYMPVTMVGYVPAVMQGCGYSSR